MTEVLRHQPSRWRATASGWCHDVADPTCVAQYRNGDAAPGLEASVADATAGTGQQITSGRVRFHATPPG